MRDKTVSTIIRVQDPVVRDHTVHGVRIMPGVTFLELIYRTALAAGFPAREVELRKIFFVEPVAASEAFERRLVLRITRSGEHWKVHARSQRWRDGQAIDNEWQENASAELHLATDASEFETSLPAADGNAELADLSHVYASMLRVGIRHGDFMRCSGKVMVQKDGIRAALRASPLAASLAQHFHILPSLLDTATGLSAFAPYASARFAEQPCVPIYIDRFRALERFGEKCEVFLPFDASQKSAAADFSRDERIDFFGSNGKLVARLEGLAFKRIRSTEAWERLTRVALAAVPEKPHFKDDEKTTLKGRIRGILREIAAGLLGKRTEEIEDEAGFYESGFESSHLLEVVRQLEKRCGREFYPTLLFEYASIALLAEYLAREVGDCAAWSGKGEAPKGQQSLAFPKPSLPADQSQNGIAIIGMSGRYPKARTLEEFWENLRAGRDCIEEIPPERWDHSQYPDSYAKWGGFIDDYDKFDPLFFNLSPREAELMDPQERIFLETVWATLEDAGYTRARLKRQLAEQNGRAGVFVGVMWGGYQLHGAEEMLGGNAVASSSGYWSLANRISYFFDFQGPSMAVDTACSSSLTAIHLACQSIQSGECQVAIAGGVNLTLHPSKYVLLCQLKMASSDGRCRSFGAGGDGYVPGEGAGAVLLKPLARALADGDRIHGVIRGTAINHGGRSNGYSVPNPNAQAQLIAEALQKSGVDPSTIGYLEAHGTGTALGDPIEIAALTKAFESGGAPKQSCPIGSLKSSIGHLEAAAGIAALTKVLLQFKHHELVPSLHAERLNSNIEFGPTPFYVQREAGEWLCKNGLARRAGISSFGVGGANAHSVVEEWPHPKASASGSPQILPFSARNEERLHEVARAFDDFLRGVIERSEAVSLEDISWTLQTGREPMECRVAFVSRDLASLQLQLRLFLTGSCQTQSNLEGGGIDEDSHTDLGALLAEGRLEKLAVLWGSGVDIDWRALSRAPGRIVSLPNYPFARERYWFSKKESRSAGPHEFFDSAAEIEGGTLLKKRFTIRDRVLADHRVRSSTVLPGAAVLEMASRAEKRRHGENHLILLKHVVWLQPVRGEDFELELKVQHEGDSSSFELRDGGPSCAARGKMLLSAAGEPRQRTLDLARIRAETIDRGTPAETYSRFAAAGLNYGTAFRVIKELRGNSREALATLSLSASRKQSAESHYTLILDGAFQSVTGIGEREAGELFLPFSVDEVELTGDLPAQGHAHARLISRDSQSQKFDIDVADATGAVIIQIRKLVLRRVDQVPRISEVQFFTPVWVHEDLVATEPPPDRILILGNGQNLGLRNAEKVRVRPNGPHEFEQLWKTLKQRGQLPQAVVNCWEEDPAMIDLSLGTAFAGVRSLLAVDPGHALRWIQLSPANSPLSQMFSGFARTLALEHPKHRGKVLEIDPQNGEYLLGEISEEPSRWSSGVRYENGRRLVRKLQRENLAEGTGERLRKDGVYLVTGGLGALPGLVARAFAERGHKVVLAGRREPPTMALAAGVHYERADIANMEVTKQLVETIRRKHGPIRGVIHAAGVIEDGLIARKDFESCERVFQPKIQGTIALDEATASDDLDCFVLFSSLSALTGNVGQADYATANAFMDAFAKKREQMRHRGDRRGQTTSINWPWWKEGGMPLPEAAQEMLARKFGLEPLGAESGIAALFRILSAGHHQIAVAPGNTEKLANWLGVTGKAATEWNGAGSPDFLEVQDRLARITSAVLKVKADDLDFETDLGEYGVDSVSLMEIINEVEKSFRIVLEPSILTEHPTLAKFARHLAGMGSKAEAHSTPLVRQAREREPIAVIGAAGRFANAPRLKDFWKCLSAGECSIREVPGERIGDLSRSYSRWGSFVDGIDLFDPEFFHIKATEAAGIDPQQRIALELAQELLDSAGYSRADIKGKRAAVFLGAGQSDYIPNRIQLWPDAPGQHVIVNQLANMVAARVSDFFHLRGPSWTVDTACSASLVAIHQACQSLRSGESEMAIAGGVQLLIDPSYFAGFSQAGVLSRTGVCAVFDKSADGMVLGEGAGLVLLKPLNAAVRDGDQVLGLILGSATNNDGHTMGLTTPSLDAQQEVIAAALKDAEVDPATISYLEAHGTGTPLGDPVEIKAATQAFRKFTAENQFCGVGSIKSNLGHLLRSAGIASFLKVIGSLQNRQLPATLNCTEPHPRFRFSASPFYPVTQLKEWAPRGDKRRAGISSFGFGGTNCHMVLEEFDARGLNYEPSRRSLPATVFNRRRFWLDSPARNGNGHAREPLKEMLRQLRAGEISVEEAKARM